MERSELQRLEEKRAKIESSVVHRGHVITLFHEIIHVEGQPPRKWDIIRHPGAVVIIPVTEKEEILLVKQWRRAAQEIILELPAGGLEPGESPSVCAQRELQEETGFKANRLISLGGFYSAPGFCSEYLHLFLGLELESDPLPHDQGEEIDLITLPLQELLQMIDRGEIIDAKTLAGVFRYMRWKS